jgi:hypothetical protein
MSTLGPHVGPLQPTLVSASSASHLPDICQTARAAASRLIGRGAHQPLAFRKVQHLIQRSGGEGDQEGTGVRRLKEDQTQALTGKGGGALTSCRRIGSKYDASRPNGQTHRSTGGTHGPTVWVCATHGLTVPQCQVQQGQGQVKSYDQGMSVLQRDGTGEQRAVWCRGSGAHLSE